MRIAVLGATGMAGTEIVAEGLRRGHRITAGSRRNRRASSDETLAPVRIDVADRQHVERVLSTVDAAVLSVRLPSGREREIAGLTGSFLDAAHVADVPVLIVGGSAPLRSPDDPSVLVVDDRDVVPEAWQPIARASLAQFAATVSAATIQLMRTSQCSMSGGGKPLCCRWTDLARVVLTVRWILFA